MPSTHEEIQFLVEAGEIRRQTGTSGDEAQAAIALATLRLAIAAERIADAMEKAGPLENVQYFWPPNTIAHPGGMDARSAAAEP